MKLVIHRLVLLVVAGLSFLGTAGPAATDGEPVQTKGLWQFEGYAAMLDAAGKAKIEKRRLLLGLSGGAT